MARFDELQDAYRALSLGDAHLQPGSQDQIDAGLLIAVEREQAGRQVVEITHDEFTATCPWTRLPDFGTLRIEYVPRAELIELKSLKYYLNSFLGVGIAQEEALLRILHDLTEACAPDWMKVSLDYNVRGGLRTICRATYPEDEPWPPNERLAQQRERMRGEANVGPY